MTTSKESLANEEFATHSPQQISVVMLIQVMLGRRNEGEGRSIRVCLATFEVLEVSSEVSRQAVSLKGHSDSRFRMLSFMRPRECRDVSWLPAARRGASATGPM